MLSLTSVGHVPRALLLLCRIPSAHAAPHSLRSRRAALSLLEASLDARRLYLTRCVLKQQGALRS
eukprot:1197787-Pleurochrysis_carterae.AAC.1